MTREEPRCSLCGRILSCDTCGPIEGRPVWIRKGRKIPSEQVDGAEGKVVWACDACLHRFPRSGSFRR